MASVKGPEHFPIGLRIKVLLGSELKRCSWPLEGDTALYITVRTYKWRAGRQTHAESFRGFWKREGCKIDCWLTFQLHGVNVQDHDEQ